MKNHPNIMAFIPARGGSKGVPRKALRMVGDRPLIAYTIRDALAIEGVTKVFVSTDDPEIRNVSLETGAEVPFLRPAALARDDSMLEDAVRYSYDWYRENQGFVPDIQIIMSPTHPFRRKKLINNALNRGLKDPQIFNLGTVAPAEVSIQNYWAKSQQGMKHFEIKLDRPKPLAAFYQSAFSFNIVFNCRPNLQNRRIPIVLNEIESIDIDEPKDLELARAVIAEGLYPFNESH